MTGKRYRLEKLDMDEVSLVASGDDPMALQVLAKAHVEKCGMDHSKLAKGETCEGCGYVSKISPEGGDMSVAQPIGVVQLHRGKSTRRKKRKKLDAQMEAMGVEKSRRRTTR